MVRTAPLGWWGLLPERHVCCHGLTRVEAELTCSRWFVSRFLGQPHAHLQRSPQCVCPSAVSGRGNPTPCVPSKSTAASDTWKLQGRGRLCFPKSWLSRRCCCSLNVGGGSVPRPCPQQCLCSHSVWLWQLFPTVAGQVPPSAGSAQGPFRVSVPLCRFSDLRLVLALGPADGHADARVDRPAGPGPSMPPGLWPKPSQGPTGTHYVLGMSHKSVSWLLGHFLVLEQAWGSLLLY